jgi:hypothetical protein
MALKLGIIQKKGAWYYFGDVKIQGDLNFYHKMKTSPDLFDAVKKAIEEELANAGAAGTVSHS